MKNQVIGSLGFYNGKKKIKKIKNVLKSKKEKSKM